jgi:site-specific DNA-adenine methylase
MALFRYSGNKERILKKLDPKLPAYKRAVEPYVGGGSFLLSQSMPGIGYDSNKNICDLWAWLKSTTPKELIDLERYISGIKDKCDIRNLELTPGAQLYVRVNMSGIYVGQLSSWILYPQHSLPVEKTIKLLPKIKDIDIIHGNCHSLYKEQDGDFVFIDPPYKNTFANYKENAKKGIEEEYHPDQTREMISRIKSPIIFTYGTDAPIIFPEFNWKVVMTKKVPMIHSKSGGTKIRTEHVAFINY